MEQKLRCTAMAAASGLFTYLYSSVGGDQYAGIAVTLSLLTVAMIVIK